MDYSLDDKYQAAVDQFLDKWWDGFLSEDSFAQGRCKVASLAFLAQLRGANLQGELQCGKFTPGGSCVDSHYVVAVEGVGLDFAVCQFEPDRDAPSIGDVEYLLRNFQRNRVMVNLSDENERRLHGIPDDWIKLAKSKPANAQQLLDGLLEDEKKAREAEDE